MSHRPRPPTARPLLLALALAAGGACSAKRPADSAGGGTDVGGGVGTDGTDGTDGSDGTDGTDGSDGTDGTDGSDGTDGGDGALPGCSSAAGDAFELVEASISGDRLATVVAYSGGCAEHDFTLCWPEPVFLESDPVQVNLEILHDGHGDACEAYPSESRDFDLAPLAAAWRAAYGAGSGELTIHLHGQTLAYRF